MKYLLLALLASITAPVYAQFDISLSGGAALNSALSNKDGGYEIMQKSNLHKRITPYLSLKAAYNTRRWHAGIGTGMGSFSGSYSKSYACILLPFPQNEAEAKEMAAIADRISNPRYSCTYVPLLAFANVKSNIGSVTVYGGITAGGMTMVRFEADEPEVFAGNRPKTGYIFGVQAGARLHLKGKYSLNAEIAPQYLGLTGAKRLITLPVTTGIVYSF